MERRRRQQHARADGFGRGGAATAWAAAALAMPLRLALATTLPFAADGCSRDPLVRAVCQSAPSALYIPGEVDTTDTHTPTPEVPRRTSLVRNLRRPWVPREHSPERTKRKGFAPSPCAVTLAKSVAVIGARYPAQAGQAGEGGSPFDVCMYLWVLSPVSEGGKKIRRSFFLRSDPAWRSLFPYQPKVASPSWDRPRHTR